MGCTMRCRRLSRVPRAEVVVRVGVLAHLRGEGCERVHEDVVHAIRVVIGRVHQEVDVRCGRVRTLGDRTHQVDTLNTEGREKVDGDVLGDLPSGLVRRVGRDVAPAAGEIILRRLPASTGRLEACPAERVPLLARPGHRRFPHAARMGGCEDVHRMGRVLEAGEGRGSGESVHLRRPPVDLKHVQAARWRSRLSSAGAFLGMAVPPLRLGCVRFHLEWGRPAS